ncbi:MAG: peptidase [Deltaproteobacteria bacterium]|nr:MAG: peptidase [Deltaproteobacteria bacterium]RLC11900.1 MAG: peptidase [Deltaproteobacteria bacterium]
MTQIPVSHHAGRHCASTGLCNLVNFHGIEWSESMCFGLGAGLGIWYISFPSISPSRMVHVRSLDIEDRFFNRIGQPFAWEQFKTPEESEQVLCARLELGVPVILQTDIYHLPYYESNTHYPGHVITVWGYDRDKKVFFVTDTERKAVLQVPFKKMRKARFSMDGLLNIQGNLYAPQRLSAPESMPDIILQAIKENSRVMIEGYNELSEMDDIVGGLSAFEKWEEEIRNWKDLEDWRWAARFTYQTTERRGTGGGAFRLMYADFLNEAADYVPEISSHGLPRQMIEAGLAWQDLSLALKKASNRSVPDFTDASARLNRVKQLESAYHKNVMALFNDLR